MKKGVSRAMDDDAAEGRTTPAETKPLRSGDIAAVPPQTAEPTSTDTPTSEPPAQAAGTEGVSSAPGLEGQPGATAAVVEGEPEVKKVRLSGAQKKAAARARQQEEWEAKKARKAEAKKAAQEGGEGEEGAGGKQKAKGQNKVGLPSL
jgi:tRNA-dihydrouridine synthase 3